MKPRQFAIATLFAVVTGTCNSSFSLAASPAQMDAARSFLDATDFDTRIQAEPANPSTGNPIFDKFLEQMKDSPVYRAHRKRLAEKLPAIRDQMAEVYATKFSAAELMQLTKIFRSPIGKKYVAHLLELQMAEAKLLMAQVLLADPQTIEALEGEKRRQARVEADRANLEQLANAGNPDAMYRVGTTYCNASNPPDRKESMAKCLSWKTRAAESGHGEAQFDIGFSYIDGRYGNQKSGSEMFKWLKRAAEQGHTGAMFYVGSAYAGNTRVFGNQETGVEVNAKEAEAWLQKAAQAGGMGATMDLAGMYLEGRVVKRNIPQAIHWYMQAAEKKNAFAMRKLGEIYESGIDMEPNPKEALAWYKRAAGVPR